MPSPTVISVSVTGITPSIGASTQFTATAAMSNGSSQNVTNQATWQSSISSVAMVSSAGSVTGVDAGEVDIRAAYQNLTGTLHVTIASLLTPVPTPAPAPTPTPNAACGVERWAVKTLSDADATRVNFSDVLRTTISSLNEFPVHCSGLPENRTFSEEFRVYEATGVVELTRNEDDSDIHIVLSDPNNPTQTIVVEVVHPACAVTSPYVSTLSQARTQYENLSPLRGKTVTVRGVGFYDFAHGQTGRSKSCIELHPVIGITVGNSPPPTPTPIPTPTPTPTRIRVGALSRGRSREDLFGLSP
jgi:hypothetical protein